MFNEKIIMQHYARHHDTTNLIFIFTETSQTFPGIPDIRPMNDVTVVTGSTVVLPCFVIGYPVHRVAWRKSKLRKT